MDTFNKYGNRCSQIFLHMSCTNFLDNLILFNSQTTFTIPEPASHQFSVNSFNKIEVLQIVRSFASLFVHALFSNMFILVTKDRESNCQRLICF